MFRTISILVAMSMAIGWSAPALTDDGMWEYQVLILQGITAGGTIEKQDNGIYVDRKRTESLNRMAAEGWEVIAVVGVSGADHTVYLRRPRAG
jgi:hypothetical protein